MTVLANFSLGDVLITVLEIFLLVAWIWALITIFADLFSDQLGTAQRIAKVIRKLPVILTALVTALFAGALWLARGRRRETLRAIGFAFAVAGVLALLVRGFAGTTITDSLTNLASVKPASKRSGRSAAPCW